MEKEIVKGAIEHVKSLAFQLCAASKPSIAQIGFHDISVML
jgi:hypothetical protein